MFIEFKCCFALNSLTKLYHEEICLSILGGGFSNIMADLCIKTA